MDRNLTETGSLRSNAGVDEAAHSINSVQVQVEDTENFKNSVEIIDGNTFNLWHSIL